MEKNMKKTLVCLVGLFAFSVLLLSACNLPSGKPTASGPDFIMTAAVQTVEAQLTQPSSGSQPTQPSFGATATSQPSQPIETPIPATAITSVQPTSAGPTATAPVQPTSTVPKVTTSAVRCNRAQFVKDLSYPDGSDVPAGTSFTKTWRLKNTGSCVWDSDYSLVFADKNAMAGPASKQLTNGEVDPGDTVDVSVSLKAPNTPGSYEGDWMLSDGSDNLFGIGAGGNSYFWVKINSVQGTRVSMKTGRTAVSVDGHVGKKGRNTYLVGARAGQIMMVTIDSAKSLYLEIQAPDGTILLSASDQDDSWQGSLPQDGNYLVSVITTGDAADFTMNITIPVRINFPSGSFSSSTTGVVGSDEVTSYLLKAMKGQVMTVTITSPDDDIFINIYGLKDGKTYIRQSKELTTASFTLPSNQDYVVQAVSTGNVTENFTIKFKIK
jgi:hypothetical protein